ncbi:MAG: hypothetical protein IJY36_06285 [Coprobacter sp.]|nr:hypothetical protein [Coprobacter sp.]
MSSPIKEIITESGFSGISIPYVVGKYYERGLISDLESSACIKNVLEDIVESISVGEEMAIFDCDSYNPWVEMLHYLSDNNADFFIGEKYPCVENKKGEKVLFFQLQKYDGVKQYTIENLAEYYWKSYQNQIQQHRFSVRYLADEDINIWEEFNA